jgi:hypothetical protein
MNVSVPDGSAAAGLEQDVFGPLGTRHHLCHRRDWSSRMLQHTQRGEIDDIPAA